MQDTVRTENKCSRSKQSYENSGQQNIDIIMIDLTALSLGESSRLHGTFVRKENSGSVRQVLTSKQPNFYVL